MPSHLFAGGEPRYEINPRCHRCGTAGRGDGASPRTISPERNIRLLFGFSPGVDVVARLVADKLGEAIGKPVIVENVTGAAGNIAADRLAKAPPDGHTIGVLPAANIVVNGSLFKKDAGIPQIE